ncbi:response regulator [Ruminococcaceae bacterium OttesenSCG-928-D13]|nr:response regulator [Ruminococcaceae bacterium OttesenSCG-928-D13]
MYQIYLVDDDAVILDEIIAEIPWQDNGFQVAGWSTNPEQALAEITSLRPHVVFSDLKMPGLDGLALIAALRDRKIACETVMISAYGEFEDSRSFFRLEGFDYILKPIQPDDVQIVLERLGKRLLQKGIYAYEAEESTVNPAFQALVAHLTKNFRKKYTLEQLGRKFSLSPNYICNLFAKNHNTTYGRFVTDLRMKEARRLMGDGSMALKEIAINCGYSDYYHFFKVFKEYYGVSPTLYRGEGGE